MNSKARTLALLPVVALFACASDVPVGISFDPLETFPTEARWRWDDLRNVLPTDERMAALDLGPAVKEVVSTELAARGYREAGSARPDYLLSFQLGFSSQVRLERSFAMGSLSLLVRDAKSGRRVWVAFAQTEVDVSDADEDRSGLRAIVRRMLRNFPPQPER